MFLDPTTMLRAFRRHADAAAERKSFRTADILDEIAADIETIIAGVTEPGAAKENDHETQKD